MEDRTQREKAAVEHLSSMFPKLEASLVLAILQQHNFDLDTALNTILQNQTPEAKLKPTIPRYNAREEDQQNKQAIKELLEREEREVERKRQAAEARDLAVAVALAEEEKETHRKQEAEREARRKRDSESLALALALDEEDKAARRREQEEAMSLMAIKEIQREEELRREREAAEALSVVLDFNKLNIDRGHGRDGAPYPPTWVNVSEDAATLEPVPLQSDEAQVVVQKLKRTLPNAQVAQVDRVQHALLWQRYSDSAARLRRKYTNHAAIDSANFEMQLFHGTNQTPPAAIYKHEAGFSLTHSNQGMWGRGLYFAENASYSHTLAHTVINQQQLFLVDVLVGLYTTVPHNNALKGPPENPVTKKAYDSIHAFTGGSNIWVLYDNGLAYPSYLITYTGQ